MAARLHNILDKFERWRKPTGWRLAIVLVILGLLLLTSAVITYSTGGTRNVYLHLAYVPVVLGGYWFGLAGGVIIGILTGLIMGPFMPLDVANDVPQPTAAWLYRTGFFVLIGGFSGQMSQLLNMRLDQIHANLNNVGDLYAHTLKAFASLVAYRDEDTAGHCERVAHNARVLGKELGMKVEDLNYLYWAGILHDLGKVATPTEILLKPGSLTSEEFELIKQHARVGAEVLLDVSDELASIATGIRSHHERWDGTGYPEGLAGAQIPLFGRVLAVVDVFEALTSRRPYRDPWSPEVALEHLRSGSGSHFEPRLVQAFERCYARGDIFIAGTGESVLHADVPVIPPPVASLGRASRLN